MPPYPPPHGSLGPPPQVTHQLHTTQESHWLTFTCCCQFVEHHLAEAPPGGGDQRWRVVYLLSAHHHMESKPPSSQVSCPAASLLSTQAAMTQDVALLWAVAQEMFWGSFLAGRSPNPPPGCSANTTVFRQISQNGVRGVCIRQHRPPPSCGQRKRLKGAQALQRREAEYAEWRRQEQPEAAGTEEWAVFQRGEARWGRGRCRRRPASWAGWQGFGVAFWDSPGRNGNTLLLQKVF